MISVRTLLQNTGVRKKYAF